MRQEGYIHFSPEKTIEELESTKMEIVVDPKSGLIVKVGTPDNVRDWIKAQKEQGKTVQEKIESGIPIAGLTDAHSHPIVYSTLELMEPISLAGISSKKEILEKIKESALGRDPSKILVAINLDTSKVNELTMGDIEEVLGDTRAMIIESSYHGATVSRKMAENLKNFTKDIKELPGYFNKNGQITGELVIKGLELAESDYSIDKIVESAEKNLDKYLSQGITAVHDMQPATLNQFIAELMLRKKWETERKTDFPIRKIYLNSPMLKRITSLLPEFEKSGLLTRDEIPELLGLKLYADGSFEVETAKLSKPYLDTGKTGSFYDKVADINEAMKIAAEHGISSVAMHAIGDAGIQRAIKTARDWIKIAKERKISSKPFRIEHFDLPLPIESTLKEVKDLGIWLSVQPNFLLDYIYKDKLGERTRLICPHQEILNEKIPMMFGTDGMPESMLYAIYLATHAVEPAQRLSLTDALLAASLTVSHFEGSNRGSLKEGQKADIILVTPALLEKLSSGKADVDESKTNEKIAELEGEIKKVYKNGVEVYNKK